MRLRILLLIFVGLTAACLSWAQTCLGETVKESSIQVKPCVDSVLLRKPTTKAQNEKAGNPLLRTDGLYLHGSIADGQTDKAYICIFRFFADGQVLQYTSGPNDWNRHQALAVYLKDHLTLENYTSVNGAEEINDIMQPKIDEENPFVIEYKPGDSSVVDNTVTIKYFGEEKVLQSKTLSSTQNSSSALEFSNFTDPLFLQERITRFNFLPFSDLARRQTLSKSTVSAK